MNHPTWQYGLLTHQLSYGENINRTVLAVGSTGVAYWVFTSQNKEQYLHRSHGFWPKRSSFLLCFIDMEMDVLLMLFVLYFHPKLYL